MRSAKLQIPSSREAPSNKLQSPVEALGLQFEIWDFSGAWSFGAMSFPFNVYLAAAVSAFFTTLATMPLWRRWCLRTAAVDDPGQRKIHDQPTPLAGGLGVMTGLVLPTLVACLLLWWQGAGADGGKSLSTPPPSREASGRFELL